MSGPYKNWSVQERQRAESPRTQNARDRFHATLDEVFGVKSEVKRLPPITDLSMRRVEPEEKE